MYHGYALHTLLPGHDTYVCYYQPIKMPLIHLLILTNRNLIEVSCPDPEYRIFNRVISDISVVLRETILTVQHYIETVSPVKSVRVISISTTEITDITRLKKTDLQGKDTLK